MIGVLRGSRGLKAYGGQRRRFIRISEAVLLSAKSASCWRGRFFEEGRRGIIDDG